MAAKTCAVIGASPDRSKFGNKSLRAHQKAGYTVYPVNPRADEVEGISCYPSIADVPTPIDRVTLYLNPALGLKELDAIAAKKPGEVWFNPGTESPEVLAKAKELGIPVVRGCSIVDLGMSPSQFPG